MARVKISEFQAKTMLAKQLGTDYAGISVDTALPLSEQLATVSVDGRYVVKVDQAIKQRFKRGLVKLDRSQADLTTDIEAFAAQGFRYCLVEPMLAHQPEDERYLALEAGRDGTDFVFSPQGGIDIESAADSVQHVAADDTGVQTVATALIVPEDFLKRLRDMFDAAYGCFLEINPLVVQAGRPTALDIALEVDGEAAYLSRDYWTTDDVRSYRQLTAEETAIADLAATSRASLRYEVINPDGAIWLLLSGGGASVTVADEVSNRGYGELLGNYGEYSGNPSEPETFAYTDQLLRSLLASTAAKKVLVIAGGVANFTDVRTTFAGVIRAIDSHADALHDQAVKVFVRRGGPHEVEGLAAMRDFLAGHDLLGEVHGPELALAESVSAALESLRVQHV